MTPEVTESQVIGELRRFLIVLDLTGVDGEDIVRGQANRVPEPKAKDFIVMTPTYRRRLATNVETWSTAPDPVPPPTSLRMERDTEVTVQLDIHGPNGADNAQSIATIWRSSTACTLIDSEIFQPLFASDGQQMPFINGENQYEDRWVMSLVLQANVAVSTPFPFADTVDVIFHPADEQEPV